MQYHCIVKIYVLSDQPSELPQSQVAALSFALKLMDGKARGVLNMTILLSVD